MNHMNIGQAAAAAGVTPKMIRHYESLGLIPQVGRTDAGYRLYGEREISMLRFIRQARSLGFSIQQIEELVSLWRDPRRESQKVKQVAQRQLQELEQRQRELDQMRSTLEQIVVQCRGDFESRCAILDHLESATAGCGNAAGPSRARRTLKEVRPGERRPTNRRAGRQHAQPPVAAHAALAAWTRAFGPPTGA